MNVKAENIQLDYGNHVALKNISFELKQDKIYGLLGRNGAGKTSLLSLLASFREPTTGNLTINGETPFENAFIMQNVSFLYDKDYKDESDNIIQMLQHIQQYRPHFDMEYAEYLIDRFKLDRKKPIKQYSKGMQSSLNVIIGLASRSPLTILDEVYLGMDAPAREIFYKEILEEQERHPRMFILSTHLVSEMDYLFDEVIFLDKGSILLQEEIDTLSSRGAKIIGNKQIVNDFIHSKQVINTEQLGDTVSVTIYGEISDEEMTLALEKGLDIRPVSLQDLFVYMTEEEV